KINRRTPIPPENPAAQPFLQEPLGAGIAVVLRAVSRMLPAEFQPDDVAGMPFVESRLLGGSDHIVGRGHHSREVAHPGWVIQDAAKWKDLCHMFSDLKIVGARHAVPLP